MECITLGTEARADARFDFGKLSRQYLADAGVMWELRTAWRVVARLPEERNETVVTSRSDGGICVCITWFLA